MAVVGSVMLPQGSSGSDCARVQPPRSSAVCLVSSSALAGRDWSSSGVSTVRSPIFEPDGQEAESGAPASNCSSVQAVNPGLLASAVENVVPSGSLAWISLTCDAYGMPRSVGLKKRTWYWSGVSARPLSSSATLMFEDMSELPTGTW